MRLVVFSSWLLCLLALRADGQEAAERATDDAPDDVLTSEVWEQIDSAVERALVWLVSQQQADGAFPSLMTGQPGVTSLCTMAFISHGNVPGDDRFGPNLDRAIDFVLECQKESGLVAFVGDDGPEIVRRVNHHMGTTTAYNHAISSLTLSELYGMSEPERADRIREAVTKSLAATLLMQRWPKDKPEDRGGWRYVDDRDESDSDLSITGWQLMFLRSARNAGFDVPKQAIDDAVAYVRRCYADRYETFEYWIDRGDGRSRAMAGAGILALAHAGYHKSKEAEATGGWILKQDFGSTTHSCSTIPTAHSTGTTTRYSTAARACISWAASIGRTFTRGPCGRSWPIRGPTAPGPAIATKPTASSATHTRPH